ncbi:MAG TPA: glycosyltransferase family 9 protein [Cytophagales bacterium]
MRIPDVRKIAILRANALGDFVVTLPALAALRAAYPDAEITLLGRPWHAAFLVPGRTPVDRVAVVPVMPGIREEAGEAEDARESEAFFSRMAAERFDLALGFHGRGVAANPFLARLGARVTAGLTSDGAAPLDHELPFDYYQSEVVRYLDVVALAGAAPVTLDPAVAVLPADRQEASAFLDHLPGFRPGRPYVVLHPCAVDVRRMWPAPHFATAGDALAARGYQVLITGSEADRPVVDSIAGAMQREGFPAAGGLSLGGLSALLAGSALTVASDTGPLHLARAVGTRTVGIHWAPNLVNWGPVTRARHRAAVSWRMPCPQCGVVPNDPYPFEPQTEACRHLVSFVQDVGVAEVLQLADGLLKTVRPAGRETTFSGQLQ